MKQYNEMGAEIARLEAQLHDYQARVIPAETRVVALEAALLEIASQKTSAELDKEDPDLYYDADFEYAFDTVVAIARAVLETKP